MWTHKVVLNWYGELHTFYTNSVSDSRALHNAVTRLASKLQVSRYRIRQYFNKDVANYYIERNKE